LRIISFSSCSKSSVISTEKIGWS